MNDLKKYHSNPHKSGESSLENAQKMREIVEHFEKVGHKKGKERDLVLVSHFIPMELVFSFFLYLFIRLFIYSFYSFIHLFIYSFIHLFIYSFIHSFIHSFNLTN